jgi:SAM-dependent methyltransferase
MTKMQRRCQPEIMEQPDLDPAHHVGALQGLSRVNLWSRSSGILWAPLRGLALETSGRPLRVLDLATGAGDLPIRLWKKARRAGLDIELSGCDISPVAIEYATATAARAGATIRFFLHDVLQGEPLQGYDVVMASLFLHHQETEDAARNLLRRMADMAGRMVLINDLIRSPMHLLLAHAATRLLTTSYVVHADGPRSVAAAWTMAEALRLAEGAGLSGARTSWRWPFRFLLTWRRPA